jgi:hypothetical protein
VESLPSIHLFKAALRVAATLDQLGSERAGVEAACRAMPTGGVFGASELMRGLAILEQARLIYEDAGLLRPTPDLDTMLHVDDSEAPGLLVTSFLEAARPVWVETPIQNGRVVEDLLPDDARETLRASLSPERREALLMNLARKWRDEELLEVGEDGERFVAECFRRALIEAGNVELASHVVQCSSTTDALGYDISVPTLSGDVLRVEVKSTRRGSNPFRCYLSRNEADVGVRDANWLLVACAVGESPTILGWASAAALMPLFPTDMSPRSSWRSVELTLEEELTAGLPSIAAPPNQLVVAAQMPVP